MNEQFHEPWRDLLPWYAMGILSATETDHIQYHLAECPICQQDLAQWQIIAQAVQADVTEQTIADAQDVPPQPIRQLLHLPLQQKGSLPLTTPSSPQPSLTTNQRSSFSIAAVLLVVLIVVTAGWFGLTHRPEKSPNPGVAASTTQPTPQPSPTPTRLPSSPTYPPTYPLMPNPSLVIVPVQATDTAHAITFAVEGITIAADRTLIFYTTQSTKQTAIPAYVTLQDSAGHSIEVQGISSGITDISGKNFSGVISAAPLSKSEQNASQQLKLVVLTMGNGGGQGTIGGPWSVTFTTHPAHQTTANPATVTRNGITVQLVHAAEIVPTDTIPGGLFLYVRISSKDEHANCPAPFLGTAYTDDQIGLPTSPIQLEPSNGATITTPTFNIDTNNITLPNDPFNVCLGRVGPFTYDEQVIFVGQLPDGVAHVVIPELVLNTGATLAGPWTFQVPIA